MFITHRYSGQAGYNQLVQNVISQKSSIDTVAATEAIVIIEICTTRQWQEEEERGRQAAEAELIEREVSAAGATAATGQSDQQASPRSSPSARSSKNNKVVYFIHLLLLDLN